MELRIKSLIDQMTLTEKIGQMVQIDRVNVTSEILRDYSIGSIISAAGSTPRRPPRHATTVGGYVSTRPLYFLTMWASGQPDPELVKKIGAATAIESRATGIPFVFAPCVAVCRDPRWGRCYESYSEETEVVKQMTDIILGLQGEIPPNATKGVPYIGEIVACAKHFVGDGGTVRGKDENNTIIDWHGLLSIHMPGYYQSIIKGVSTIMVSYSSWNGQKMHGNKNLVTDFLKGTLKFRNDLPMGINYSTSLAKAINAGVDMVMVPPKHTELLQIMTSHVKNNVIPISRIDDAVRRILRVKFTLGLFENPLADYSLVDQIRTRAHRDLAREAVRKSLVLLKNGKDPKKPLLPLPKRHPKSYPCSAWLPGNESEGVADLLFGDYGFTGKLSRTWFKRVDQLPMNVGDEHYDPLFPFGFGLTTQPTGELLTEA
ncbi:hypothetical protein DH2020_026747 [Rehmannia glutinosa]|uniref:Glycoside hydrolase family 3 N-terminal domain-containing protein n=1 Tax=Rehmannia glutinosa TaxID=99300 RepID=A0ABR0VYW4_REHGL